MSAISEYFRTALVIDDRLESDYRQLEALDSELSEGINDEPESELVPPPEEDETPIRPSSLVNAFLDQKILCSVLELDDGSDLVKLAVRGVQIADLLILDWLLFGETFRTVEAIKTIAEEDDRLTVIVVFTGAHSLKGIATRLIDDADFEKLDSFVLKRNSTVVLIFGKPGITLTGGEDSRIALSYSELPKLIREDLEMVFKGFMSRFAFRGINVLRESAPRMLSTFNSDLDVGALVHRALLPEPSDAGSQFVGLLVSDFEQALIEDRVDEEWDDEAVKKFLSGSSLISAPERLANLLKSTEAYPNNLKDRDDLVIAQEAVAVGLLKSGVQRVNSGNVKSLVEAFGDDRLSDKAFATLMCSTGFDSEPPRLELGVVVKDPSGNYWLCTQPLCDSVRIQGKRAFPMMPLREFDKSRDKEPDVMIKGKDGQFIAINFEQHPYKLNMLTFDSGDLGSLIAQGEAPDWWFEDVNDAVYQAITRLRSEVAVSAAQDFASRASRVGVDVSEWLRKGAVQ